MSHTVLPWKLTPHFDRSHGGDCWLVGNYSSIEIERAKTVAIVLGSRHNASGEMIPSENAEFVLLACNSHDRMVEALTEIVRQIDQGGSGGKVFSRDSCIAVAREALKLAKGE